MNIRICLLSTVTLGAFTLLASATLAAGTLRYATVGEPPTLDQQVVTSDLSTTIAHHMFEGLYTFDASNSPVGLLATGEEVADDGKTITIMPREGVTFHNGQDLTSADVVASLERWGELRSLAGLFVRRVSSVVAGGGDAVPVRLARPCGPWRKRLAVTNGGPADYPESLVEGAGK